MAEGSMPWQVGSAKGKKVDEHAKYQYHPGGDQKKTPKDAPSALNVVIVPNVTLPKVSWKTCLIGWAVSYVGSSLMAHGNSRNMISSISGAKICTECGGKQKKRGNKQTGT